MKRAFALCLLLVLTHTLLAQQWEVLFEENVGFYAGCVNDNNETFMVGHKGSEAYVVKILTDGTYSSSLFSEGEGQSCFTNILELDGGVFLLTGFVPDSTSSFNRFWIAMMDNDMNILNSTFLNRPDGYDEFGNSLACQDVDGTIIISTNEWKRTPTHNMCIGVLLRINRECEILHVRYLYGEYPDPLQHYDNFEEKSLRVSPTTGELIAIGYGDGGCPAVSCFDYEFNLLRGYQFLDEEGHLLIRSAPCTDYWYDDGSYLYVSNQNDSVLHNKPHLLIAKANLQARTFERVEVNRVDSLYYCAVYQSMAAANDSTIFVAANCRIGHWAAPCNMEIFLCDKNLEILGYKGFFHESDYWPLFVIATKDSGCIVVSRKVGENCRVKKFLREDFNPIPCLVKEVPKEQIGALAYPNPTSSILNIDISLMRQVDGEMRFAIADIYGRTHLNRIIREEGNVLTADVSSLPSGTYTYQIFVDGKIIVCDKFIKK